MQTSSPLSERGLAMTGQHQYVIEAAPNDFGYDHWNVDMSVWPPTCDCPAFEMSQAVPAKCKHTKWFVRLELFTGAAMYDRIFATGANAPSMCSGIADL